MSSMQEAKASKRILAMMLDLAIFYAVSLIIAIRPILALIDTLVNHTSSNAWSLFISALLAGGVVVIFMLLYFLILPLYWKGQTIGKRFFGIRIVKENGDEVNFQTLFLRDVIGNMFVILLSFGLSILINLVILLISNKHQTFPDTLAFTKVIDVE